MAKNMTWIGQGPIDFGVYDASRGVASQGYIVDKYAVGCANSSLVISVSSDKIELKETCSGNRATLKSVTLSSSMEVSLEMREFSPRELAIAFKGTQNTNASGTVSGEVLATSGVSVGDVLHTEYPFISGLTLTAGSSTLTEGTDYEILSADHGRIRMLTAQTGSITADYNYAQHDSLTALTGQDIERGLVFNGISGTGERARIIIPKIRWRMDGDFNWIGDDYATLTLRGEALYSPELATNPQFGGFMKIDALPSS